MEFFEFILHAVLPLVSVRAIIWLGFRITEKQELKSFRAEDFVVKTPYIQEIVGLMCILFGIAFIVIDSYGILSEGGTVVEEFVCIGLPILFGAFLAASAIAFKIVIFKDRDYFTYRSLYKRKRKIFYDDIDYCEISDHGICVFVKGEKYFVSGFKVNFFLLNRELHIRRMTIKEKKKNTGDGCQSGNGSVIDKK